jgi:hypothetical protein
MGSFDNLNSLVPCVEDFQCFGIRGIRHPQGESGWKAEVHRNLGLEVSLTLDKWSLPMGSHNLVTKKSSGENT